MDFAALGSDGVEVTADDRVAIVRLNRASKRNALNAASIETLLTAFANKTAPCVKPQ